MTPCVYTTQHEGWLKSATSCQPNALICFRSGKKWARAASFLYRYGTLPILFRPQDTTDSVLACRFVGELVDIRFVRQFNSDAERLAWLKDALWFQRQTLERKWQKDRFDTWDLQYGEWEVQKFMAATTWYTVRAVRGIQPLPLPRLRKLNGGCPLAPNYARGYSLCQFPADQIRYLPAV